MVEEIDFIKNSIIKIAEENGYDVTKNVEAIAKAKYRFFGVENFKLCPCDRNSDRYCISKHCKEDIERDDVCHCNCICKRKS